MNDVNQQDREEYETHRELTEGKSLKNLRNQEVQQAVQADRSMVSGLIPGIDCTSEQNKMSPEIGKLAMAMSKAQGMVEGAAKASENPFFKSRYADLSQVWDACREALSVNELAIIQMPGRDGTAVTLITLLIHSSGQWIRGVFAAMPMKQDAQAVGSVTTYLRRYSLAAMVGVAQVDDDGEAAVARSKKQIDPKPMDHPKIVKFCEDVTTLIDGEYIDAEDYTDQRATKLRSLLTNDEAIFASEALKQKKPDGTGKSYASVFREVLGLEREYIKGLPKD